LSGPSCTAEVAGWGGGEARMMNDEWGMGNGGKARGEERVERGWWLAEFRGFLSGCKAV